MLTDYLENLIAQFWKGTTMTPPAQFWWGLHNGDPGELGTGGVEVTTTLRPAGRVGWLYTNWRAPFTLGSDRVIDNAVVLNFGTAAATTTFTHLVLWDAQTGGNILLRHPVVSPNPRTVPAGSVLDFLPETLRIGFALSRLTNFSADALLNYFRGTPVVPPSSWYLAAFSSDPGVLGDMTSETTSNFTGGRPSFPFTNMSAVTQVSAGAQFSNINTIEFGRTTSSFSGRYVCWVDAATGGNVWRRLDTFSTSPFLNGVAVRILPGSLISRTL